MAKREKISGMDDLKFVTRTGVVLENQLLSQTHVRGHSSGESQYIGPDGGHIRPQQISISSSTSEKAHLFIRGDDGREFDVSFVNAGVAAREGNRVSLVYCGTQAESAEQITADDHWISAFINHSTGKSRIYEARVRPLAKPTPSAPWIVRMVGPVLVVAGLPVFAASVYYGFKWEVGFLNWVLFWCLYFGLMLLFGWLGSVGSGALANEILAALRQRVDELLQKP